MTTPAVPARRSGVRAFLAITFAVTWLPFLPAAFGGPAVPLLMPFAPAIAAVVVRRWVTREGFSDLGLRPHLRSAWPWLGLALAWPLAAIPLAVAVASVVGVGSPDLGRVDVPALLLWAAASLLAAPIFLGEELGWRGYLQVRIWPGRPLLAAGATGVVWGVWHYPLWLTVLELPIAMFPLMTASMVVTSVFLGWVSHRSGTVWAASLGHSTNNTFEASFGATAFTGSAANAWLPLGPSTVIVLAEAVVLLAAVLVGARTRAGRADSVDPFRRHPQHQGAVDAQTSAQQVAGDLVSTSDADRPGYSGRSTSGSRMPSTFGCVSDVPSAGASPGPGAGDAPVSP
jgi:membrane protease YdiL (CAAX protease family)